MSTAMFAGSNDPFRVDRAPIPTSALRLSGAFDVELGDLKVGIGYKETLGGYWTNRDGSVTLG